MGKIIWQLSKGDAPNVIDYDSKILTSLLKDTLGGTAKTTVFVCIGPSIMDIEATRDTFRFAESTGKIKARNDFIADTHLQQIGTNIDSVLTFSRNYACQSPP